MNQGSSQAWRNHGDALAFDDRAWEFQARQFHSGALVLLSHFEARGSAPSWEQIMALPTAQYLLALSLELIGKAYFLKAKHGPPESVYTHKVSRLIAPCQLNDDQMKLLVAAEELVIWAGRYPTPKWTKESLKEKYDVPSTFTEGIEHIDASALPNAATAQRCHEFVALFETIRTSWATA